MIYCFRSSQTFRQRDKILNDVVKIMRLAISKYTIEIFCLSGKRFTDYVLIIDEVMY